MGEWAVWLYLAVSAVGLTVQSSSLARIVTRHPENRLVYRGMRRTATCRVAASTAYVGLGLAGLYDLPGASRAAFFTLLVVQVMWMANGLLDGRLSRRLKARG